MSEATTNPTITKVAKPTLLLKEISSFELTIKIAMPPEKPVLKGHVYADAISRSRDEVKELRERILNDEFEDDGAVLRELYLNVRGLGNIHGKLLEGDEAFVEIITGKFNTYLLPALIDAYFDHFNEARVKNFGRSRGR